MHPSLYQVPDIRMKSNSARNPPVAAPVPVPGWLVAAALVPLGLGGYLLTLSLTGGSAAGCGIDSGCGSVLGSAWSRWFGIPVAALALPLYLLQFVLIAFPGPARAIDLSGRWIPVRLLALLFGGLVGGASWFAFVQVHLLHAFCPWCLATHFSGIVVCALALQGTRIRSQRSWIGSLLPLMALSAVLSAAVLGFGQRVSAGAPGATAARPPAAPAPASPTTPEVRSAVPPPALPARYWTLPISGVTLPVHELPLLGNPAAPRLVLHFFDYTCKHCRAMHPILMDVLDHASNQVAVVSLPVPLEMECNPLLKRPIPEHIGACGLAKLGLAVWKAAPSRLREFDDWVFSQPTVPAFAAAESKAIQLAGEADLRSAQASPEIDGWIRTALGIYEAQYRITHLQNLPELLVGTNLYSGVVRDPEVLRARVQAAPPASVTPH